MGLLSGAASAGAPGIGTPAPDAGGVVVGEGGPDGEPADREGRSRLALLALMAGATAATLAVTVRRGDLRADRLGARWGETAAANRLPSIGWLVCALSAWMAWQVGGAMTAQATGAGLGGAVTLRENVVVGAGAYGVGLATCAALLAAVRVRTGPLGLRPRALDPLVGLGMLALVFPMVYVVGDLSVRAAVVVAHLTGGAAPDAPAHETLVQLMAAINDPAQRWWWWATIGLVGVAAPVFEELVYRMLLQTAMIRASGRAWLGIGLTSVLFALAHGHVAPWHAMPALFALSLALGWAFERTGRLWVCVVMHGGFNALNVAAVVAAGV